MNAKKKNIFKKRKAETLIIQEIKPTSKYSYDGNSETSPPASIPSQN
jgi:hypothetical protein